jgi:hypothetical protein
VFSAIALFGLCSRIAGHRHFANMKDGDFFVVWLPFRLSIILPHPYDFYVVGDLITRLLWISMVAAIVLSGAYFWRRNAELNSKMKRNGLPELS